MTNFDENINPIRYVSLFRSGNVNICSLIWCSWMTSQTDERNVQEGDEYNTNKSTDRQQAAWV